MCVNNYTERVFCCTLCGECCRDGQKVWLNPVDTELLAGYLIKQKDIPGSSGTAGKILEAPPGFSPEQTDKLNFLVYNGFAVIDIWENGVLRPRIKFKNTPAGRFCPFLINDLQENGILSGKCSLHYTDAKPLVCRLAPFAREINLEKGTEVWFEVTPVPGCPGWQGNPPPDKGRRLKREPELDKSLRADLNMEENYFRTLSAFLLRS